jgi:hypothetical protein
MIETILRAFVNAPDEAQIIGRILAGYGELEFEFCNCLGAAIDDQRAAIRTLFRVRSEDSRILVGDGIMRPKYAAAGLADTYNETLGAIRFCKSIRNQYAHCHWLYEYGKGLFFTSVDAPAKSNVGPLTFDFHHVEMSVLTAQERYFCYTDLLLTYLQWEFQKRAGKSAIPPYEVPKTIPQPPRHSLPGTYSPLS